MNNETHTMYLTTDTAVAIWHAEVQGQLSDGYWENTRPLTHWKFWCHTTAKVDPSSVPHVIVNKNAHGYCYKKNYNIVGLMNIKFDDGTYVLRDRMLKYGRMAKAATALADCNVNFRTAEYMPATFEEFRTSKTNGKWQYDFVAKYMENVSEELAAKFYESTYTVKELKRDLLEIKMAMKNVQW